jgi:hypothetical protein
MGGLRGMTRNPSGLPLPAVKVTVHGANGSDDKTTVSGADGGFSLGDLKPGHYEVTADKEGFAPSPAVPVEIAAAKISGIEIAVVPAEPCQECNKGWFFGRFARAYCDD